MSWPFSEGWPWRAIRGGAVLLAFCVSPVKALGAQSVLGAQAARGGLATFALSTTHSSAPEVIVLRLEVRVRDKSLGLIQAVHVDPMGDTSVAVPAQDLVLLDVAALARHLEYAPQDIRQVCANLTRQAAHPMLKRQWPCHATIDHAAALLKVPLEIDLPNAAVVARGDADLPVLRRERLRQSAMQQRREASQAAALELRPSPVIPRSSMESASQRATTQLDYLLHVQREANAPGTTNVTVSGSSFSTMGSAQIRRGLFGGTMAADIAGGGGMSLDARWHWSHRSVRNGEAVRTLQLGIVPTVGPVSRELWGLAFGSPSEETHQARSRLVSHAAQPDWEYMALAGDRVLAGERSVDGQVQFRVPITGETGIYDIVAMAPDGREYRETRLAHGLTAMPAGERVRHRTTIGRCITPTQNSRRASMVVERGCRWHLSTAWQWRFDSRSEVHLGTEWVDGSWAPMVGYRSTPHPSWVVSANAQWMLASPRADSRHGEATAASVPAGGAADSWRASVKMLWQPSPTQQIHSDWSRTPGFEVRRLHVLQNLPGPAERLQFGGWWSDTRIGANALSIGRIGLSTNQRANRLETFVELQRSRFSALDATTSASQVGVSVMTTSASHWSGSRPWWLRATLARGVAGMQRAWQHDIRVNMALPSADVEVAQTRGGGGWRWMVLVAPKLVRTRLASSLSGPMNLSRQAQERHAMSAQHVQGMTVSGGASFDGRAWHFAADRLADHATVEARVFLDRNGNGVLDASDTPLPDVVLSTGSHRQASDVKGIARISGVNGREPVDVAIDVSTLEQPCWVVATESRRLQFAAAHIRRVDFPVQRGTLVEGRLASGMQDSSRPLPENITLVSSRGRRVIVDLHSDGWFSTPALVPDEWTVVVGSGVTAVSIPLDLRTISHNGGSGSTTPCAPHQVVVTIP
jgi:hypothetical protein